MALPKVGLEAAIENLGKFDTGASNIVKAYNIIEKKAGDVGKATQAMGLKFDEVANRWRTATGQFASNAQLMAAGVENPKKALEELGKKADVAKGKTVGLGDALKALGSPLSALGGQFVGLGDSLLKVGAIAGGAALAGILALSGGIATFAVSGIGQAKDLDQQIADIAATMGKTKEEIAPLKQEILDLSLNPNLTVNVTQAADAIQLLAQNGVEMEDILAGAAQSTVELANATGSDFVTSANIATGAMQIFKKDISDLSAVADGVTGVLVTSKFDANDYALALSQAGGVAASTGVSLEDFNTALAGTAFQFNGGSDAGTSFKALLQRLSNPTKEMITEMDKFGISLFNDEGKIRDLADVTGQLNAVFNGTATITETVGGATKEQTAAALKASESIDNLRDSLSTNQKQLQLYNDQLALEIGYYGAGSPKVRAREIQIERLNTTINKQTGQLGEYEGAIAKVDGAQATLVTTTKTLSDAEKARLADIIGESDGSRALLALAKMTEQEFRDLSATVNKSGQASKAAATRVDSLSGAWEILQGIIQAIQIQVGDLFLPILRQVTSTLAELGTGNSAAIVAFFDSLIGKGQELFTAFNKYGPGGLFAALGFKGAGLFFKKLSKLFGMIGGDAGSLSKTIQNTLGATFEWLQTNVFPLLSRAVQFVTDHFAEFKGALIGISVVLGGAVFASLAAGLFGLLTPINLIIAGAGILGAEFAPQIQMIIDKLGTFATIINTLGLGDGLKVIGQMLANQLADAWIEIQAELAIWGTDFWDWTVEVYANIPTTLTSLTGSIATFLKDEWPTVNTALVEWSGKFWGWVSTAISTAGTALAGILVAVAAWAASPEAQEKINLVGQGIGKFLVDAIGLAGSNSNNSTSAMIKIAGGLLAAVGGIALILVEIGGTLVAGIVAGIGNAISGGKYQPWTITEFGKFATWVGQIDWKGVGAGILVKVLEGLQSMIAGISEFWETSIGGWTGIFTGHDWGKIGKSIMSGILEGINKNVGKVLERLKQIGAEWIKSVGAALGYGSPAKEFIPLGESISQGIVAGINEELPAVEVALDSIALAAIEAGQALAGMSIDTSTATLDKLLNLDRNMLSVANKIKIASSSTQDFVDTLDNVDEKKFDILRREMKGVFGDEQKRNTILNTLRSGTKGVNEQVDVFKSFLPSNLEKIGLGGANAGAVNNVIGHFLKAFQESERKLKDMQHEAFIQAGRTAISIGSSLADIISSSADVLDSRVLTLQSLVNSGLTEVNFEGSIISATEAQRQLNQALLEQQAIQDDLLETQQNQAKLDFLNKQLDLLETIKKAGLDPKDILGGLELGLDASIPDIIAATNRLVTAMVNQVNEDLQIASPSKVMARAGKSTGLGFGLGMLASIPDVMKATSRMVSSIPSMVSAPALGGGTGGQSVSNTNFNMTVNTGATPQAVIGQYAIMQAMVG